MKQYLTLLKKVLDEGAQKSDRTGVGVRSLFGYQIRFDLSQGYPVLTTKQVHLRSVIYELLWFLSGDSNIRFLKSNGVSIWNHWADEQGELGPVYGRQWRSWQTADGRSIDQLSELIDRIRTEPDSRRLIVNAWNVGELDAMALPPCHLLFQFYVANGRLSCQLYQRSTDVFLGLPFNIASYSLLTAMIAQQTNLIPGEFVWVGGDVHLYNNHIEQANQQLQRLPTALPTLHFNRLPENIFQYKYADIEVRNYQAQSAIRAPIAV